LNSEKTELWRFIMTKSLLSALLVASALAAPTFAFAQSDAPVTRAEVRAQLSALEKAGYNPATNDNYYPQGLQAAQQRIDSPNGVETQSYGPSTSGTSASGMRATMAPASPIQQHSIYFGH
jgi:ABC-type sugar transport system substrate-binding protein